MARIKSALNLQTTGAQYNAMIREFGRDAETCRTCGSEIWLADEMELYMDVRALTDNTNAYCCPVDPKGLTDHEPVL